MGNFRSRIAVINVISWDLPSSYLTVCHGKWPIEIDGLPINSMVICHGKLLNNQMVMLIYDILYSQQDDVGVSENGLCTQNLWWCAYDVHRQCPCCTTSLQTCVWDFLEFPCVVNPMPSISPISGKNGDGTLLLIVKARHILIELIMIIIFIIILLLIGLATRLLAPRFWPSVHFGVRMRIASRRRSPSSLRGTWGSSTLW